MKVAVHAGQLLQPVPGGTGRYVHAMLAHLPNHDVTPIAFAAGGRPSDIPERVPWIDLGAPRGALRYEMWHRLRRPPVRIEVDVLHATSLAVPPRRGMPLLVTVHDVAFLRVPHSLTRHGVQFHKRGLALARRDADFIICNSAFTGRELEREGFAPERIQVIPFGVDLPGVRGDDDVDAAVAAAGVHAPFVLTVGTIEPRKDLPTLVRAVEQVRAREPNLSLVVVGARGWGDVKMLDRPFVHVLGPQPDSLIDALYRRANAFCVASIYEGFGLPALEAMARGAPTITTTGSAPEEFVRGAGLLFAPRDVDACAHALERVLTDAELRDELAHAGRTRATELTWERTAEGHARAYARAVTRAGS